MKKVVSLVMALCICFTLFAIFPSAQAVEKSTALSFSPTAAVLNSGTSTLYLSDKEAKKVYSINTETYEQKSITFDLMPESLFYKDGKLYVSLCTKPHDYYWWTEDQSGAFAIIDCATFTKAVQYNINVDPYDIVVSKDNTVYIASGSGQWTNIYGFDQNGKTIATASIRNRSTIEYNPVLNKIYSITSDSSPRNMSVYTLKANGTFEASYEWPYHGDYSMGTTFHFSPDGAYILNNSGNVFTCSNDQSKDMKFKISLNKGWTDLAFNEDGTKFYTSIDNGKQIYAYNYSTFEGTATYETQGYPKYIYVNGDTLTAISTESFGGNTYFIEKIDLSTPQATIETKITSKSLSYEKGCALLSAKSSAKTVFNGDMMYLVDSTDNALYAIDTTALTETKISFPSKPNSLYYENGELFVGFGSSGVVAILNAKTFETKSRIVLGTVFSDLVLGKDGYIYIMEDFGSSAFSYARSYSRTTGQLISSASIYSRSGEFTPQPNSNKFYWADTGVSPQDINALVYENGTITAAYDSPYHGDYNIGSRIRISPDGKTIFTSAGSVFKCSTVPSKDPQYQGKFASFVDLAFDAQENRMFTSQSRPNLNVYDAVTYESKGFLKTVFPVKEMAFNNGAIIAVSAGNSAFYLEILNSSDVLQVVPEKINVSAADTVFLAAGRSLLLKPSVQYNDGTSKSVDMTAKYTSSNEDVAIVTSGVLQAKASGHAVITIECEGITKSIDVYVDFDITAIHVAGYDIGFSPSKTSYMVILPSGTTEIPDVTFEAPEYVFVEKTSAITLPGATTLLVTDQNNSFTKTYSIFFHVDTPPQDDVKPFIINDHYEIINGLVHYSVSIVDNPDYCGTVPNEFSVVVQLMSFADGEPRFVSAVKNARELQQFFDEQYYAIVMVVDQFGQQDYVGILLADPKRT